MKKINKLPRNVLYVYTTENGFELAKIYRSRNGSRLYIESQSEYGHFIYSYTLKELRSLSDKIVRAYGEIKDKAK